MALDKENIIYSLLASTILANLDRPTHEQSGDLIPIFSSFKIFYFSAIIREEKISFNENIQPLQLPSEISSTELIEAEQKTEEKKEIILENQPLSTKEPNVIDKLMTRVWYKRPISDEGDLPDQNQTKKIQDDDVDKKTIVPDIDTSHSTNNDEDSQIIEQKTSFPPIPSWINDQVYGDKVSVMQFSEKFHAAYNII
jgi:hypothetical protein